jgi:hypothetical protein
VRIPHRATEDTEEEENRGAMFDSCAWYVIAASRSVEHFFGALGAVYCAVGMIAAFIVDDHLSARHRLRFDATRDLRSFTRLYRSHPQMSALIIYLLAILPVLFAIAVGVRALGLHWKRAIDDRTVAPIAILATAAGLFAYLVWSRAAVDNADEANELG